MRKSREFFPNYKIQTLLEVLQQKVMVEFSYEKYKSILLKIIFTTYITHKMCIWKYCKYTLTKYLIKIVFYKEKVYPRN